MISSAVFAQLTATLQWAPLSQNCPRDLDPHVIHGSLDPPESSTQTASRSVQPRLQGSLTDHSTRSVTIGRIYVGSTAMQPNNTMQRLMHRVSAVKR